MTDLRDYLKNAQKPVLLYGTGNGADIVIDEFKEKDIRIDGIFASDGFVRKRTFRGFEVLSYSEAKLKFGDMIVLVVFGTSRDEVIENIVNISHEQELYAVDVPVCGDNIFDMAFAENHSDEIKKVYDMLADEESKRIFEDIVLFKLTGKISYLTDAETDKSEVYENILKLSDSEKYVDLGAYNGDSVAEFIKNVKGYDSITALEPDKKNFEKLTINTKEISNITLINKAAYDKDGTAVFSSKKGRGNSGSDTGVEIAVQSVDNILSEKSATYIKFDIEGSEKKAIEGAVSTIKNFRPKMNIACYHRSEDIFSIPLQIASIRSDYKIHIRHFKYIPAWDTQFYFI